MYQTGGPSFGSVTVALSLKKVGDPCSNFCLLARLFHQAFISFRKYVLEMNNLGADLHIVLSDICCGAGEEQQPELNDSNLVPLGL